MCLLHSLLKLNTNLFFRYIRILINIQKEVAYLVEVALINIPSRNHRNVIVGDPRATQLKINSSFSLIVPARLMATL